MKWLYSFLASLLLFAGLNAAPSFSPPPNPPPPTFNGDLLPIVLVNNSLLDDSQVYVLFIGSYTDDPTTQVFVQFDSSGVGTLVTANPGDNATNYTQSFADFPTTTGGRVCYMPYINSSLAYFSLLNPLDMPVNSPHSIVQPNFSNPADPNYNTIFDIFEYVYLPTPTQISADATAVSFFSLPLYGYISTPDVNTLPNTGLYQPRNFIMSQTKALFNAAVESTQWNGLFLDNGPITLRILSTGKGMTAATPVFDPNYLDNVGAYGYSYIADIWSGLTSFYRTNPLMLTIPAGSFETYTGVIAVDNSITFTSSPSGYIVYFPPPTTVVPTTSQIIFQGNPLYTTDTSPNGDGVQVSKLFEEAIIASLVPTANTLSNPYLTANRASYYTINSNLSVLGQTTGPWYDLYSKALHSLGFIYTFAFDEPLWPEVQISSQFFTPNETYLAITLGPIGIAPTFTTLTSSENPANAGDNVTFTATVSGVQAVGTPTGTVIFTIDGVAGAPIALVGGIATFQTSSLAAGNHTITAAYSGDPDIYLPSVSPALIQVISSSPTQNPSTTTISSSRNPAQLGQSVTFTATVSGSASTPTGSVIFSIDDVQQPPVALTNGQATFTTSSLTLGAHFIQAIYSGDSNYIGSTSNRLIELIFTINEAQSSTTLTSSVNPTTLGQATVFTATVTGNAILGTPTGNVIFVIDGAPVATVALVNGHANLETSILSLGKHTIRAVYTGSNVYRPSISNSLTQYVTITFPPRDVQAKQVKNKFATQTDVINKLTWKAPLLGPAPVKYKIYSNSSLTHLIATIDADDSSHGIYHFTQHNRKKNRTYNYFIVAINGSGDVSPPVEVSLGGGS